MSIATQTLLGLYQIGLQRDQNFFDKLTFPEGIDHDVAVTNILHQGGDFEVLYPSLDFMNDACEMFSTKWQRTFEKWLAVMSIDYEPLENYNRLEHWSESTSESSVHSLSSSESTSLSESMSSSESTSTSVHTSNSTSNSATTDNDISAFNANTLQNDTSAAVNAQTVDTGTNDAKSKNDAISQNMSLSRTDNKFHEDNERDHLYDHEGRVHGNIGVMTTQAMFKEEWELSKLNIYDEIYILFAMEFLIPFSY